MVSNFGELQKTVSLIGAKLGAPKSMLLVRESSPEDGTPHVEFKSEGFEYVSSERGYEIFRKHTRSLDELLFWIISRVAFNMAVDYELSHRVAGKDSRIMIFEKYLSELSRINKEWGKKASDEIEAVLLAAPFSDS